MMESPISVTFLISGNIKERRFQCFWQILGRTEFQKPIEPRNVSLKARETVVSHVSYFCNIADKYEFELCGNILPQMTFEPSEQSDETGI